MLLLPKRERKMSACCISYFRLKSLKVYGLVICGKKYTFIDCIAFLIIFFLLLLKSGSTIDAKTYPDVTMLFSDIVGFTSICSRATPFMVISMLEELYKEFDEACGYFDVYKVETIGDAYCVASGLHRPGSFDAHKVAWMGLRMMEACTKHITHDGQPIGVRSEMQLSILPITIL